MHSGTLEGGVARTYFDASLSLCICMYVGFGVYWEKDFSVSYQE